MDEVTIEQLRREIASAMEAIVAQRQEIERLKQALRIVGQIGEKAAEAERLRSDADRRYAIDAVNALTVTTASAMHALATDAGSDTAEMVALLERLTAKAAQPAAQQVLALFLRSLHAAERGEAPPLH